MTGFFFFLVSLCKRKTKSKRIETLQHIGFSLMVEALLEVGAASGGFGSLGGGDGCRFRRGMERCVRLIR